mmetsp:Transcript_105445/g.305000  ORF Transcript_105445/g.305000 Transcript_105445/m.305000 type:complete len:257 (-) Transcript_105445:85-855(-)
MEVARRAQASANGRRLFVSGVAPEVKKTDLQCEFGEFGHVTDIELPLTAKGVAFVEFDNALDAAEALHEVTGRKLKGMVLKVKMADIQKTNKNGGNEDKFDGMVRVENDYRGAKGGGRSQVVPTGKQEYEERRMPVAPARQPPKEHRSRSRGGGRGGGRPRDRDPSAGRGQKNKSHSRRRESRSRSRSASRKRGASRSRSRRKEQPGSSKGRKREDASRSAGRKKERRASRSRSPAKNRKRRAKSSSASGRSRSSS